MQTNYMIRHALHDDACVILVLFLLATALVIRTVLDIAFQLICF